MKKTIITSLALLTSVFSVGQNIKVISELYSWDGYNLEKALGNEWAEIDSLVVLTCSRGMINESDFPFIRKCCEEGRLSGIDFRRIKMENIPSSAFSPSVSSDGVRRESKLKYITLPAGLRGIGESAFLGTNLITVDIPRTVESIGSRAFGECPNLRSVILRGNTPMKGVAPDAFSGIAPDAVLTVDTESAEHYRSSDTWKVFKSIYADDDIFRTLSVHFDGSLTAKEILGKDSANVDSLIVTGVPTASDLLYMMCLPVFSNGRLYGLNLYDCDIEKISDDVDFFGYKNRINYLNLPKKLKKINDSFLGNTYIRWCSIPNTIEEIGIAAFNECRNLNMDLIIPEGVKIVGFTAFYNCYNLKSIYLPSTLSKLGEWSFYMPSAGRFPDKVLDVYMNRMTPPEYIYLDGYTQEDILGMGGAFNIWWDNACHNVRLFVPVGAKKNYENNKNWEVLSEIIETPELTGGPNGIDGTVVSSDADSGVTEVYTVSGRLVWRGMGEPQLSKGLYIMKTGGKAEKRVVE